jgi:hypothetical protein
VLKSEPSLTFVAAPTKANVFINDQPASPTDTLTNDLHEVDLQELDDLPIGSNLRGNHFETFNCCKHYTCNDGTTTCLTALQTAQQQGQELDKLPRDFATCAAATDAGAITSNVDLAVPTSEIPFPLPGFTGNTLFAQVAFCAELPRVVSKTGAGPNGEDGWFETPVDKDYNEDALAAAASDEDAFAEIEVYHSIFVFFEHIKSVLGQPGFCLGPNSMTCNADGTSVIDATSGLPVHAFHVTTNVLFPSLNLQVLATQILGGHGKTAQDPIVISDYQRIPNAAFVPALSGGPINIPPELAPLAQLFTRPYDSNVFFQGHRDFAYDGDVVHHEFTHGVVHALNANLAVNGVDDYGTHVEPGALNEGWADYMSSSFAGNPQVGEYASAGIAPAGETGLRDNDNQKKCPDDLVGEVHADSEPWAGTLWATRQSLNGDQAKIDAFDKAVLAAVAASDVDENFDKAGQHLVAAVTADASLGSTVASFVTQQLTTRSMTGCVRVWPLSTLNADKSDIVVKKVPTLFQPAVTDNGLKTMAPALFQLAVSVPAKSGGFTITWGQAAGGLGLSNTTANIGVLVHETSTATDRLHWSYAADGTPSAKNDAGEAVPFDPTASAVKAQVGAADNTGVAPATFTQTLSATCAARTFIVDIMSLDQGATITNIDVKNTATTKDCTVKPPPTKTTPGAAKPCGCYGGGDVAPMSALVFGLAIVALRRRRARARA